jgi:tRNA1Val (adenine37-N6)-methyltransferase
MPNSYFQFKQFTVQQDRCAMKVTTDACLFGAWVAKQVKGEKSDLRNVLDAGTGTALLSLMYAQENLRAAIDAIEIDDEAVGQAKENVEASPFTKRIHVLHGDIKTFEFKKKYDLIISNPPFYENELRSGNTKKNIAHHHEGLLLEELLTIIKETISGTGIFSLLLPYKRNKEIKNLLQDFHIRQLCFIRQTIDHDYFRIMLAGTLKNEIETETIIDEISIRNDQQQYTEEFIELLKDYYLGLSLSPP